MTCTFVNLKNNANGRRVLPVQAYAAVSQNVLNQYSWDFNLRLYASGTGLFLGRVYKSINVYAKPSPTGRGFDHTALKATMDRFFSPGDEGNSEQDAAYHAWANALETLRSLEQETWLPRAQEAEKQAREDELRQKPVPQ